MPIEGVNAAQSAPSSSSTGSVFGGMGSEDFMKLLVAQLRYQNPLQPSDPAAMLQQTAQFAQMEALQKVASTQQQLLGLNQTAMSTDLVGKTVTATTPDGDPIEGVVDAVRFTADGPVLRIGTTEIRMTDALEVRATAASSADPSTTA